MSQTTDEVVVAQNTAVMAHMRSELAKFFEERPELAKLTGEQKAAASQNILQVVGNTWSQLHQAQFNREMAELQRSASMGSGIALPPPGMMR